MLTSSVTVRRPPNCLPVLSGAWPCDWMEPAGPNLSPLVFLAPLVTCPVPPNVCPIPLPLPLPLFWSRFAVDTPVSAAEASALEGSVGGGCERGGSEAGRKARMPSLSEIFPARDLGNLFESSTSVADDSEPPTCTGA